MKTIAYMTIEMGLALLAVAGFAAGPLLLWPRWMLSPVAQESLTGGAMVATLFLLCCLVYAGRALNWRLMRWIPLAKFSGPAVLPLVLAMGIFYFWPVTALPAPDPHSAKLLFLGPRDQAQMTIWTLYTLFGYVPLTLASLFWHGLTMFVVWTHNKRAWRPEMASTEMDAVLTAEGAKNT